MTVSYTNPVKMETIFLAASMAVAFVSLRLEKDLWRKFAVQKIVKHQRSE
jgi:hypothetical protein